MPQQKGFTHAFLIIGLVVALMAALGFIFWQNFIHKEPVTTQTEFVEKPRQTDQAKTDEEAPKGYLAIDEWGVKLKLSIADKVEYSISSQTGGEENAPYELLGLKIKQSALKDTNCASPGADLMRQKNEPDFSNKKIDGYYYYVTGAPGICSEYVADTNLQTAILNELKPSAVEKL